MSEPTDLRLQKHHGYRSWSTSWYDSAGKRRCKRFGREGEVSEAVAKAAFRHWLLNEFGAKPYIRNPLDQTSFSARQLADSYIAYARAVYTKHGRPTSTVAEVEQVMRLLADTFGDEPASEISAPRLAALRDEMIAGPSGRTLSVKTVNNRLAMIKQAAKWARERGLITATALADIVSVANLRAGRTTAKAPRKVMPVSDSVIARTRERLPPTVRAMVDLQLATGMRPGEVCIMRPCDIERRDGGVWLYRPAEHKTEHKGRTRVIPIGPQAQAILAERIAAVGRLTDYLFSPAMAQAERRAEAAKRRRTPDNEGNRAGTNRKASPLVSPGERYEAGSYRKAIGHACRAEAKATGKPFAPWHPHQLRHNFATRILAEFDSEHVADTLGHAGVDLVRVYAERSLERSIDVARRVG